MILFPAILRGNHCKNLISSLEFSGMLIMLCCPRLFYNQYFSKILLDTVTVWLMIINDSARKHDQT